MVPPGAAAPGGGEAISAEGLTRRFGDKVALAGVDLRVPAGSVLGLLGPNGAGKTTTVRILTTLLRPDGGHARVAGHDVVGEPSAVRARIGLSGQYAAVDERLTARENLYLVARLYGMGRRTARAHTAGLLDRFALGEAADRPSGGFSGGMRRRLDLAGALAARPAVVFLDEPTTGLDPRGRNDTWEAVQELVTQGTTVLLTTQYLEEADALADSISVIDHGRVIARGTAPELKAAVGGERITLTVTDPAARGRACEALAALGPHRPELDSRTGSVTVATEHGTDALRTALESLAAERIDVRDVALAPPTLDDVFLTLTGGASGAPPEAGSTPHAAERAAPTPGAEPSAPRPSAAGPSGSGPSEGGRRRAFARRRGSGRARKGGAHAWRP
ncbi:ATP-binding cassette domain-containing protein [Streptomyces tubbatahanensis]|uniref:ATP-binding cassette domain-containing protein n=1 Tax=Streptomyces tubbatahanensis TaxID=2923272 RepID=A0ABY3Y632_9ACTN|nr:ATP-binding cassette domain-containing protein [Streptomyces tubbatahanensis]UNT01389.1 ATP-binding cassette domain-containing protein [Streptomyces tubbatahanensis]